MLVQFNSSSLSKRGRILEETRIYSWVRHFLRTAKEGNILQLSELREKFGIEEGLPNPSAIGKVKKLGWVPLLDFAKDLVESKFYEKDWTSPTPKAFFATMTIRQREERLKAIYDLNLKDEVVP